VYILSTFREIIFKLAVFGAKTQIDQFGRISTDLHVSFTETRFIDDTWRDNLVSIWSLSFLTSFLGN